MAKMNDTGLYQNKNGTWYYRIKMVADAKGNPVDIKKSRDENGQPFTTKSACKKARDKRLVELQEVGVEKRAPKEQYPATLQDMWDVFLAKEADKRAKSTVAKHKSMWKNYMKDRYGKKKLKDISVSDMQAILVEMYNSGLQYSYVEGVLKVFYLLYGIAYRENAIDPALYTRMFLEKGTKLKMPPKRAEEENQEHKNRVFQKWEIKQIFDVVRGTNLETAFLFGYYCGLRVGEVFGLRWSDIDWDKGTIKIRRQLQYNDNAFEIGPVKTIKGLREIEMPTILQRHLIDKYREQERQKVEQGYRNTEHVINNDKARSVLVGADFINRKENGELLTINSVKYYAKKIKAETDVKDFKFHSLRKTHLTQMASLNTPLYELMYRAGHSKVDTTMSYYLGDNEIAKKKLIQNLNSLDTEEPMIELDTLNEDGSKQVIKESDYVKLQRMTKEIPHVCEQPTHYSTYHPKAS